MQAARDKVAEAAMGPNGRRLFDEHTRPETAGHVCGVTWGEMAPPGDKPGVLHWCRRPMMETPDPDGGPAISSHSGKHRCDCGEYAAQDEATRVVCRFPVDKHGTECGAAVVGINREQVKMPGSMMRRTAPQAYQIIRSGPCGHVVRRGF